MPKNSQNLSFRQNGGKNGFIELEGASKRHQVIRSTPKGYAIGAIPYYPNFTPREILATFGQLFADELHNPAAAGRMVGRMVNCVVIG